jgi:hypothetical protein
MFAAGSPDDARARGRDREQWELPNDDSVVLREVGSDAAVVSLEAVEARDPDELEYLDIRPFDAEDANRQGRAVRAELPLSEVLDRAASEPAKAPSYGELFDALVANNELRAWIDAQPADSWGRARLQPALPGAGPAFERLRLEMVTTVFERGAIVTANADCSNAKLELPGDGDRTRTFPRTAGTLPPGISALPDSDFEVTEDLHLAM